MNIFKIFTIETLKKNLKSIWNRFPVTIVVIFLVAILLFLELHHSGNFSEIVKQKIIIATLSLILTFVFSIGAYLSTENLDYSKGKRNLFQFIPIIFGVGFYFTFSGDMDNFENIIFFLLSLAGIISYLFFAPYLKNIKEKQSIFYTYFYDVSVVILMTVILGGVLFWLGSIGFLAVDALFDLNIDEKKTYGNWAIFSFSIFAPLFTLTQISKKSEFRENHFNENMFFSFLIKFVAIPFIIIYFLILYAYSIKVLINFGDWPKGEVSWMVIGFSIFAYITYIFSYIFEKKNKFIQKFRKILPYIVFPQIFMLFYAIYLRINQYDITINRYFVVVFGLWLLLISVYYIFSKNKYLSIIPVILTLFTIIISIGPWSVYSLPESRQLARLEANLSDAKILENGKIIPLNNYGDITQELSKNIYSGVDYLCDFDNCDKIKKLFPIIYKEILEKDKLEWEKNREENIKRLKEEDNFNEYYTAEDNLKNLEAYKKKKYKGPNKWEIVRKITDKIKVKDYFDKFEDNKKYIEYSKDYKKDTFPIDIKGYSKIYRIQNFDKWNKQENYAEYDILKQEIIIKENGNEIEKISTKEIVKILIEKFGKDDSRELSKKDLTFEINQNGKIYKLFFENISIKNPDYKPVTKENSDKNIMETSHLGRYTNGFILLK